MIPSQPVPRYWSAICSHSTSVRRRCRSGLVVLAGDDDAGHDGRGGVVANADAVRVGPEADRPHAGVTLGDYDAVGQAAERDVAAVQLGADVEHEVGEPAGQDRLVGWSAWMPGMCMGSSLSRCACGR